MADNSVDCIITDPPYGIDFKYDNYHDNPATYTETMKKLVAETNRLSKGPKVVWQAMPNCNMWHKWFPEKYRIFAACKGMVQFRPTAVQYSWDPVIFWGENNNEPDVRVKDYYVQKLAPFGVGREKINHPCPRPLEQTKYILLAFSWEGCKVLDPFMGSGTTGVACKLLGRDFIGIDISPDYCEIARKRIAEAEPLFDAAGI